MVNGKLIFTVNTCLTRKRVIHLVDQSVPHFEFKREKFNRTTFLIHSGSHGNLPQYIGKEQHKK